MVEEVTVIMEGEKFRFEREVSEGKALRAAIILAEDETIETPAEIFKATTETFEDETDSPSENGFELTDDVIDTLSKGQKALIKVLRDEDWMTLNEIVPRMEEKGRPIKKPGDLGGVRGGMTKKYGENDIIEEGEIEGESAYRLNPDYKEKFRDRLE